MRNNQMIIKDDGTRLMFETLTLFLSSILHVSPLLSFPAFILTFDFGKLD